MNQATESPSPQNTRLYIYGSCEADQFFHPRSLSQSKRPICLTDIEEFNIEDEDDPQSQPNIIPNPIYKKDIYKIACGALHTIVLTTEGSVYTFGCNDSGALGRSGLQKTPIKVDLPDPVDMISAGDNHSVFANSIIGSFYFTGTYKYLRGENVGDQITVPERYDVAQLDSRLKHQPIQKIVSGNNHTSILVGGKIFIRGEPESHTVGRRINERHKARSSLTFDGVGLNKVEDLWCGGYHSVAKVKKGSTWHYFVWGFNRFGQLGLRTYDDCPYPVQLKRFKGVNIVDVAAGTNFTIVLTEDGEIFGAGQNDEGQLGLGEDYVYEDSEEESDDLKNQIENKMKIHQEEKQNEGNVISEQKENDPKVEKNKQGDGNQNHEQPEKQQVQEKNLQVLQKNPPLTAEKDQQPVEQEKLPELQKVQKEEPEKGQDQKEESQKEVPKEQNLAENKQKEQPQRVQQQEPPRQMQVEQPIEANKHLRQEKNLYIKSFKRIPIQEKISRIHAGSEFCFAWNPSSLFSWGFGMNYVLLNGQEDNEPTPFKVKSKILNEHAIYDVAAGAQHVTYLSYPTAEQKPTPKLTQKALEISQAAKQKLSKKKRT